MLVGLLISRLKVAAGFKEVVVGSCNPFFINDMERSIAHGSGTGLEVHVIGTIFVACGLRKVRCRALAHVIAKSSSIIGYSENMFIDSSQC